MLAGAIALLLTIPDSELATPWELLFLARHQSEDGSWGGTPADCSCPAPFPDPPSGLRADPGVRDDVARLIGSLRNVDPGVRVSAQAKLLGFGTRALPQLLRHAERSDPETAARCRDVIARIPVPGKPNAGTTGLALLTFLGCGYSHLSKDVYEKISMGTVVRKALMWLTEYQEQDGAFDRTSFVSNAFAALALSEGYGLTGSSYWKKPAALAVSFVARSKPQGTRELLWKGVVLWSAIRCGTPGAREKDFRKIAKELRSRDGRFARDGALFLTGWGGSGVRDGRALSPELQSFSAEEFAVGTWAFWYAWGAKSPRWREWGGAMKDSLYKKIVRDAGKCERDSWPAGSLRKRIEASSFRLLTLLFYYRYPNTLGYR